MGSIEIDSETYRIFYQAFRAAYYQIYFIDPGVNKPLPVTSNKIWSDVPGHEIPPIKTIIGDEDDNVHPDYFYKKDGEAKDNSTLSIKVDRLAKALDYIGYKPTSNRRGKYINWNRELPVQLTRFRKVEGIVLTAQSTAEAALQGQSELDAAKACVENFYKHLAVGETKQAWNLLSLTFQNREVWQGNYERFHDGYATTLALRRICAFNPEQTAPTVVECMIFYEDEVSTYPIKGLQAMQLMSVGELDDFVRAVKKMQQDIEAKGGHGFERVPLKKLFDPTGMEFIWYECGFKGSELHKHFAKPHPEVVLRLFQCTCTLQGGHWLINNISPAKTYSIR